MHIMKIWVLLMFLTIRGQSLMNNVYNNYTDNLLAVGKPYFAPNETEHVQSVTVRIYCPTEGAQIKYTLDRSIPNDNSPVFSPGEHIFIDTVGNNFINAIGVKEGYENSIVASKKYIIIERCGKPSISPDGGNFAGSIRITFSTSTIGANIYYTLDGSLPTNNNLKVKNGETIVLGEGTTTIKCMAKFKGYAPSSISTATFNILPKVNTPIISPNYDIFTVSATLTIICSTPNVTIYYTTNGDDPSKTSLVISQGNTIVIDTPGSHIIKAYATHSIMLPSDIITKIFKIQLRSARPLLNPTPGIFVGSITLNFDCQDDDTNNQINNKIFFTMDGKSTPTLKSPFILCSINSNSNSNSNNNDNNGIILEAPGTYIIRAFSVDDNKSPSAIMEGKYELFRPDHDEYPIQIPSNYQDISLVPDLQIIPIEKEFPVNYSLLSTPLAYNNKPMSSINRNLPSQCTHRVVTGRLVTVRYPYGHLDFLEPIGGCGKVALPTATLEAYYHNITTTTTMTTTTDTYNNFYRQTILKGISESELLSWYESLTSHPMTMNQRSYCLLATPAGYFNATTKKCIGNLISSSRGRGIVQTSSRQHINFGIRNGSFITGYLNADEIRNPYHPFDTLVSGKIWLVRNGKSFVLDSVAEDEDFEDTVVGNLPRFLIEVSARSAIGYDRVGQLLILQVDGKTGETGLTMLEFADLAVELGFLSAVNLEGGDLTSMYVDGTLVSIPSATCDDSTDTPSGEIGGRSTYSRCVRPVSSLLCLKNIDPKEILGAAAANHLPSSYPIPTPSPLQDTSTITSTGKPTTHSPIAYPTPIPHTYPTSFPNPPVSPKIPTPPPNMAISSPTVISNKPVIVSSNKPNSNINISPFPVAYLHPTTNPSIKPTYPYFKYITLKPSYYYGYNNDDIYHPRVNQPSNGVDTTGDGVNYQSYSNMTAFAMADLQRTIDLYRFISFVLSIALFISVCVHIQNCLSHRRQSLPYKQGDMVNGLEPSETDQSYRSSTSSRDHPNGTHKKSSWFSQMKPSWDVEEGEGQDTGYGNEMGKGGSSHSQHQRSIHPPNIQLVTPQTVITEEYIQNKKGGSNSRRKQQQQVEGQQGELPMVSEQHWQQRLGEIDLDKDSEEEDEQHDRIPKSSGVSRWRKKALLTKRNGNSSNSSTTRTQAMDDDLETVELYGQYLEKDIDKNDGGSTSTANSMKPVNNNNNNINKISNGNNNASNVTNKSRESKTKRKSKKKISAKGYAELSDDIPEISGDEDETQENPFYRI